ncbi:haloacid dehalogenase type II [Nesterenkonia pannonica]|uniref:haloacid dehalogenase type II n=1 Tax=Nesterenkonia pannonica TaxID=1548602 RepID=UPI002164C456|nr:haloacid dehalogenase type II [Nesterenkonia pannonica]
MLRDGFALTSTGDNPDFVTIAQDGLHRHLRATLGNADHSTKVVQLLDAFKGLGLHPDVAPGVTALSRAAELVTLSNGSSAIAESLLDRACDPDTLFAVPQRPGRSLWKLTREAYRYAVHQTQQQPGDVMLVAVHPWDIHGAAAAGSARPGSTGPKPRTRPPSAPRRSKPQTWWSSPQPSHSRDCRYIVDAGHAHRGRGAQEVRDARFISRQLALPAHVRRPPPRPRRPRR